MNIGYVMLGVNQIKFACAKNKECILNSDKKSETIVMICLKPNESHKPQSMCITIMHRAMRFIGLNF